MKTFTDIVLGSSESYMRSMKPKGKWLSSPFYPEAISIKNFKRKFNSDSLQ